MAENNEQTGAGAPAGKGGLKRDLPETDSPPLSPAGESTDPADAPEPAIEPTDIVVWQPQRAARFRIRPRHRRAAMLAASVAIAAAIGVVAGVAVSGGFAARKPAVSLAERQALQRKIAKLGKEVAGLKVRIAAADKPAQSTVAKISEKITERLRNAPEITGSIPAPPAAIPMPLPSPRPAVAETRPPVVHDWSIRFVRAGIVYVQNRGETYQVQRGAPLPGLGPVREIRRQDGRWYVVTPRGLIVAMRDRAYFERF